MELNSINDIKFGNPSIIQKNILEEPSYLDSLFDDFYKLSPPLNGSEKTKKELNELVGRVDDITLGDNQEHLKRYFAIQQNTPQFLINNLRRSDFELEEFVLDIESDINPLVYRLKYQFQRPRPYQLAYYYKLKFFPLVSSKIDTPSYPSKTALLSTLVCKVLADYFPEEFEKYKQINQYILSAPTFLGTNFISDIEASTILSNEILKNKEFTKKYNI